MHLTEIYYEKVFPIAPYVNEKIGVKGLLEPGDNPDEQFEILKEIVNGWGHKLMEERPEGTTEYSDVPYRGGVNVFTPNEVIREPEKKVNKLAPDKAIRVKYAKALVAKEEETIKLLENMYDFDASQK